LNILTDYWWDAGKHSLQREYDLKIEKWNGFKSEIDTVKLFNLWSGIKKHVFKRANRPPTPETPTKKRSDN
jgi:hypothetical protein